MMSELFDAVLSWPTFVAALFVFGFAPGAVLRLIVLAFHHDDPRRRELIAELYAVPRLQRPVWVAEQLEVALFEGLGERLIWAATGRIIHRWHLESGVTRNNAYPESFWIPSDDEKLGLRSGDLVKLMFQMKDGSGERMWVIVTSVRGDKFKGELNNTPFVIPRLEPGKTLKFRRHHIIDIDTRREDEPEGTA